MNLVDEVIASFLSFCLKKPVEACRANLTMTIKLEKVKTNITVNKS